MLSPEVASPASQPLSPPVYCHACSSLLVPAAVIKHGLKAPFGGRRGFIWFMAHSLASEEVKAGAQSRNLETGTEAEALLACS